MNIHSLRYLFYGTWVVGGLVTIWHAHGADAGLVMLFSVMAAFVLGAAYQRNHPQ